MKFGFNEFALCERLCIPGIFHRLSDTFVVILLFTWSSKEACLLWLFRFYQHLKVHGIRFPCSEQHFGIVA
jgi:hypothetical protein